MKPKEITLTTKDLETPWFQDFNKMKQIESIADRVKTAFRNDYLVSCGNSFAWILKTLETKHPKQKENIEYLSLSGRLNLSYQDFGKNDLNAAAFTRSFKIDNSSESRIQNPENLKNILIDKKLSPESIIKRFKENGQRTIFFDFAETGKSLASLLHFLTTKFNIDNSQKLILEEALGLNVYYPHISIGAKRFHVNSFGFWNLADDEMRFHTNDHLILKELANSDMYRFTAKNPIFNYQNLSSDFDPNTNVSVVTKNIRKSIHTVALRKC